MRKLGVAVVGCGNIASFYLSTRRRHPVLDVIGVMDRNEQRAALYAEYFSLHKYPSLEAVLDDPRVELVVNLTNPRSHYDVSRKVLEAGRHVYSEKPLAMKFEEAQELVRLAEEKGLVVASAPSRILGETGQTMWAALRAGVIGKVHAAYAEMDGGLIYRANYKEWKNELGIPWSYLDELETGCTIEHAGYSVSWLSAFFGPVDTVSAYATCQIPDLGTDTPITAPPPDLTVACLKFKSGVVARLTTSWIAPHDHSIRIFGDTGVLSTSDIWKPRSPVRVTRNRTIRIGPKAISLPRSETYPMVVPPGGARMRRMYESFARHPRELVRAARARLRHLRGRVDFCLGPVEVAQSIIEDRPCRLSADYCLHNTEVVLAIHESAHRPSTYEMKTTFEPMHPMPWALP